MRKSIFCTLAVLSCVAAMPAHANWEYSGTYLGDGWYNDDGSRFTISVRGGAAAGFASVKNDIGSVVTRYYINPDSGVVATEQYCLFNDCEGFLDAGTGELADLPVAKNFREYSFAAGASVGWVLPHRPRWRLELGWDHISEAEYNSSPMLDGDLTLSSGAVLSVQSGAIHSKVTTDIISAMAFYDFFDGMRKPLNKIIPYVGFGAGYADSKTVLNLSDPYGDLSTDSDLQDFGKWAENDAVIVFNKSEHSSANAAGILAAGMSYGINENMFFDLGARVAYIPKIKWVLENEAGTRNRDMLSAENMIYASIMLGLRFEF